MLKYCILLLISASSLTGFGQSVAGINLRHIYDPQNEVELSLKVVNDKRQLTIYYKLQNNSPNPDERYLITWTKFDTYTQKDGISLPSGDSLATSGQISFPAPEKQWLLVAKVTNQSSAKSWKYVQVIDARYPTNGFAEGTDGIVFKPYVYVGQEYALKAINPDKPLHVYYYKTDFPAAAPPFAEKGSHVDRFMFADSSFVVANGQKVVFRSRGLYLVQQDTSAAAAEGFTLLAVASRSYPKLTRIEDIPDPLIFVCAQEEHDELVAAGNDKSKVDKVILDITRDKDRAKNFMRSYFRRVEVSDMYFSSFKEGWKTDRGMIYLIFGLPDEVSRTGPNEIWTYKTFKERFTFVKIGSVYDPNNLILQRSTRYTELWFNTVDLWRKSRFSP